MNAPTQQEALGSDNQIPDEVEIFLIAALSVDGYIAHEADEIAMWTSKEDKQRFIKLTKDAGIMIMGATTFNTLPKPLKGRHHVIYSRTQKYEDRWPDDSVETTDSAPAELIAALRAKGYKKIAICGGKSIYSLFLQSGLVTKLYLTFEPIVFGSGIKLCDGDILGDLKLRLDKTETTPSGTLFLDYSVIR